MFIPGISAIVRAISALLMGSLALAQQPQIDMAAAARWGNAKVVRYHIEGVFQGWTAISHQRDDAQGDVADRVTIDVDWNLNLYQPVGPPKFANYKSSTKGVRSLDKDCPPPVPRGEYEHFDATSVIPDTGQDGLKLTGTRTFPAMNEALQCPASKALSPSPSKQQSASEYLALPAPMMLALRGSPMPNMTVSADGKSFLLKLKNWTWTYTPSLLQ